MEEICQTVAEITTAIDIKAHNLTIVFCLHNLVISGLLAFVG